MMMNDQGEGMMSETNENSKPMPWWLWVLIALAALGVGIVESVGMSIMQEHETQRDEMSAKG